MGGVRKGKLNCLGSEKGLPEGLEITANVM
jgi:hypothetical protein